MFGLIFERSNKKSEETTLQQQQQQKQRFSLACVTNKKLPGVISRVGKEADKPVSHLGKRKKSF